jgi:hypothetical protein
MEKNQQYCGKELHARAGSRAKGYVADEDCWARTNSRIVLKKNNRIEVAAMKRYVRREEDGKEEGKKEG